MSDVADGHSFFNMNVRRSIIISADRSFLILLLYYKSGCRSFLIFKNYKSGGRSISHQIVHFYIKNIWKIIKNYFTNSFYKYKKKSGGWSLPISGHHQFDGHANSIGSLLLLTIISLVVVCRQKKFFWSSKRTWDFLVLQENYFVTPHIF